MKVICSPTISRGSSCEMLSFRPQRPDTLSGPPPEQFACLQPAPPNAKAAATAVPPAAAKGHHRIDAAAPAARQLLPSQWLPACHGWSAVLADLQLHNLLSSGRRRTQAGQSEAAPHAHPNKGRCACSPPMAPAAYRSATNLVDAAAGGREFFSQVDTSGMSFFATVDTVQSTYCTS